MDTQRFTDFLDEKLHPDLNFVMEKREKLYNRLAQ